MIYCDKQYIHPYQPWQKSLVHIDASTVDVVGSCLVQVPALSTSCFLCYHYLRNFPVPNISPSYSFFFTLLLPLSPVLTRLVAPL